MNEKTQTMPTDSQQALLDEVRIIPLIGAKARQRFQEVLDQHHYLGKIKPVGEQLYYVAADAKGGLAGSAAVQLARQASQASGCLDRMYPCPTRATLKFDRQQQPLSNSAPALRSQSGLTGAAFDS